LIFPQSTISVAFPNALPNDVLVKKVSSALIKYGYGKNTLLSSSLCCDELARPLEKDFQRAYGEHFSMGGLAGFAFGGVTGFRAMAQHIPDGGSCLVVYGPHVGVDSQGNVGAVERRGRVKGGSCCGSAAAACAYVTQVHNGESKKEDAPTVCLDAQQAFVGSMLLPYAKRLIEAKEQIQVELPMALFEAQKELMSSIIKKGAGAVAGQGKIALVGGIQINTPPEMSDFFLPLQLDIFDNRGSLIDSISID
jgi:hypothetical protein